MPKFAANLTTLFNEYDFPDRFAAAAEAGFEAVEFLFPYDYEAQQLKALLEQHHLQLALFNTPAGDPGKGEWGIAALPGREDEARRQIDMALEYAVALDCPQVHVMAGVVTEKLSRDDCVTTFVANIRYAADRFREHGRRVLLEALSPGVKANYLLKSQFDTLDILDRVGRDNVFVQLDYFHAQMVDGNLTRLTEQLSERIGHVQIASVPERHEPDSGEVNYPYLFALLDKIGYEGYVGCEYFPRKDTRSGLAWLDGR